MQLQSETAWASVVLAVAIDLPARFAVPVQVRTSDMKLSRWIPADGRYYEVPTGGITFLATLPEGEVMQTSTDLASGVRARITLQLERAALGTPPQQRPTLLDQQRTALRFLAQSSLDTYKRTRRPSMASAVVAAADELRLQLTSKAMGVQFLQLLSPGTFPMFVAYSGSVTLKLMRLERRMAADVFVMDERVELALLYLQAHRASDATVVLDLQSVTLWQAEQLKDVATVLGCLHIYLTAGRLEDVEETAIRLARRHPDVADFAIIAAECAAARNHHVTALAYLVKLQESGLPLLHRSYVLATVRLAAYAARDFNVSTENSVDRDALSAVYARLQALAPSVDPSSVLLVVFGAHLNAPSLTLSTWQRISQGLIQLAAPYALRIVQRPTTVLRKGGRMSNVTDTAFSQTDTAKIEAHISDRIESVFGRTAAAVVLILWVAMAVFLMRRTGDPEVTWSRLAWVFSSVEAVAFGAAGLLFGVTVNRQRAERAEARADANQKDADRGRSLAAALKAEEPTVVKESGVASIQSGARELDLASQIAARHARLARQLFP